MSNLYFFIHFLKFLRKCSLFNYGTFLLLLNSFIDIYVTCHKILFKTCSSMVFGKFTELCKHHHNLMLEYFQHPKTNHTHISSHSLLPYLCPSHNLLSVSMDYMFWTFHINEITPYEVLMTFFTGMVWSRLIHQHESVLQSFFIAK